MTAVTSLKGFFLIAMPNLKDLQFFHSVIYLCEHNEHGAIGIVINQPLPMQLYEIFQQIGIKNPHSDVGNRIVFAGGPVRRERGFVLHPAGQHWESTININQNIALTTSPDILQALAANQGPSECFIALGYACWEPGLLEQELSQNAWMYGPASFEVLFRTSAEQRWRAAAALLGIDTNKISDEIGHG
jgi:putative transcriptional regulator